MKKIVKLKKQENITLQEHLENFLIDCKVRGLSNDTIESYTSQINLFINFVGDSEINTECINTYVLHMRQKGNADISIKTKLKFIKTFLKFCGYDENEIKFPLISVVRENKEPYSKEEIELLLKKPTRNSYTAWRNHTIVCLLLSTGIRCRTLVNLKISDLDFTSNTILLREIKTKKKYYIPMSSTLKQSIKHYLSLFEHDTDDYLFMSLYGDKLSRPSVKEAIREYNLKRGVPKTSIHLFRHTFAINYLRNGGNIMTLKEILGHSNIATTQQYLKVTVDDLKQDFDDYCILDNAKRKGIKLTNSKDKVGR